MDKKFKQQLLKIQALQIEAAQKGLCMHIIIRGGIEPFIGLQKNSKISHIDASLFLESKQLFAVNEFENIENSGTRINDFIALVETYLTLLPWQS